MPSQFVVVVWNSDQVAVLGTATGRAFGSDRSAQHVADDYKKNHPTAQAIVFLVTTGDEAYGVR